MGYTPENNPYIPGDPYSYDLKWMVTEIKHAIELYTPLSQEFSDLSAEFTALHDYVMNYFAQLDVTDEIRQILQEMADDGTLTQLMAEYFGCVTPQMFGAIGDGIADDTAAIAQLDGKFAFIPEGTYLTSNITFGAGTRLWGSGMYKSIFKRYPGAAGTMISFTNAYGSTIRDLGFVGNYTPDPYTAEEVAGNDSLLKIGTKAPYTYEANNYCAFENIYIANSENHGLILTGYQLPDADDDHNWVFRPNNVQIHNCKGYGMIDMSSDNCFSNFYITGGHMGSMLCRVASKNMYSNFKLDGNWELYGSEFASAILSIDRGASLRFVNLDLQSSTKYGLYIKLTTDSYFNGCINNVFTSDQSDANAAYIKADGSRYNTFIFNLSKLGVEVEKSIIFINSAANTCRFSGEYLTYADDGYGNIINNENASRFFVPVKKSFTLNNLLVNGDFSGTTGTPPSDWTIQSGTAVIGDPALNGNYLNITAANTVVRQNYYIGTPGNYIFGFFSDDTMAGDGYLNIEGAPKQQLRDKYKTNIGFGSKRGNLYYYTAYIGQTGIYPYIAFGSTSNMKIYGAFLYRIPDMFGEVLLGNGITAQTVVPEYNTKLSEELTDQIIASPSSFLTSMEFTFTDEMIGAIVRHFVITE